jgi:CRISPR-associated protein (TIGR02710 family)
MRVLVMTVGTGVRGSDIVAPLTKAVQDDSPESLVLIATDESKENADKVITETAYQGKGEIIVVRSPNDLDDITRTLVNLFYRLIEEGVARERISVDFTSGTKAMSVGAAFAASIVEVGGLKYIAGHRVNGVVVDGGEKFEKFLLAGPLTLRKSIPFSLQLIRNLRFASALDLLNQLNPDALGDHERFRWETLVSLASGYRYWDIFDHFKANGELNKVTTKDPEIRLLKTDKKALGHLLTIGREIKAGNPHILIVADLVSNAHRRIIEGKYDDAVARLYRATEAMAQYRLWNKYGWKTGELPVNEVKNKLGESTANKLQLNGNSEGRAAIGMQKSYDLLAFLNDPLGRFYRENSDLGGRISDRNRSILAHGFDPISQKVADSLFRRVIELGSHVEAKFSDLMAGLQFPWVKMANPED